MRPAIELGLGIAPALSADQAACDAVWYDVLSAVTPKGAAH